MKPTCDGNKLSNCDVKPTNGKALPLGNAVERSDGGVRTEEDDVKRSGGQVRPTGDDVIISDGETQPAGNDVDHSNCGVKPKVFDSNVVPTNDHNRSERTEKPAGNDVRRSDGEKNPASNDAKRSDGELKPASDDVKRSDGEKNPASNELKPASDDVNSSDDDVKHSDGGYGWIIVASSFIVMFLIDGLYFTFGVLLVGLIEQFNEPIANVAALGGVFLGFDALSSPFAGSLSDAFGRRLVTVTGAVSLSCGMFLSTFAPSLGLLYFTYGVLGGMGYGLMCTPSFAAVMDHFDERRGTAGGIALCGSGVGIFVMSQLTTYMLDAFGLRGTFLMISGIMLHAIPCGLLFRKPHRKGPQANDVTDANKDTRPLTFHQKLKHIFIDIVLRNNASVFRDYRCVCFLLATMASGLAYFIPFTFLPEQANSMGIGKDKAAWLTSGMGIANTFGRLLAGWLGSRSFMNLTVQLKGILLLTAISLPVSLLLTTFETKMVFACVFGLLYGSFIATMPVALAAIVPASSSGKTTGLFISMLAGANLIASPVIGWSVDVTGDFIVCYIFSGSATFVAFIILMLPQIRTCCCTRDMESQTSHL